MTVKNPYSILKKTFPKSVGFLLNFLIFVFPSESCGKNVVDSQCNSGAQRGTSSVAFKVLIINCQIYFINSFIFNCLTLNIKFLIFKLFHVKFLFSENHVFHKQKRKMMTCYLREINKVLRYRTLCKSILKCGFPTKGIELTRSVLFEILGVPQL